MIDKIAMFCLEGVGFAFAVEQIDQIVPVPRVFALPLLHGRFVGVFLHREEAVPLLGLRDDLGLEGPSRRAPAFAVILHSEAGRVGVPADEVLSIVDRARGRCEKNQEDGDARIFVYEGRSHSFLDTESLLASLLDTKRPEMATAGIKED